MRFGGGTLIAVSSVAGVVALGVAGFRVANNQCPLTGCDLGGCSDTAVSVASMPATGSCSGTGCDDASMGSVETVSIDGSALGCTEAGSCSEAAVELAADDCGGCPMMAAMSQTAALETSSADCCDESGACCDEGGACCDESKAEEATQQSATEAAPATGGQG